MFKSVINLFFTSTAKDTAVLLAGIGISTISGLFLIALLTRNLNAEDFGLIITAMVVSQLVADLFDMGINTSTVRFIASAEGHLKKTYTNINYSLKLLLSVFAALGILIFSTPISILVINNENMSQYLQLSSLGVFLMMIISWGQNVFRANNKFLPSAVASASINILRSTVVFTLIIFGISDAPSIYFSLQAVLIFAVVWIVKKYGEILLPGKSNFKYFKDVAVFALPVGLSFSIWAIYSKLDQILIMNLLGEKEAGIYGLAFRISGLMFLVSAAFASAISPRFASMETKEFINYFKKTVLAGFFLGLLSLFIIPFAPIIVPLFFGENYLASVIPFQILLTAMAIFIMSVPFSYAILYHFRKPNFALITSVFYLLLSWLLLNFLIPEFASVGAAFAILAVHLIQLLISSIYFMFLQWRRR